MVDRNGKKQNVKINRTKRMWFKYRYIVALIVVVLLCAFIIGILIKKNSSKVKVANSVENSTTVESNNQKENVLLETHENAISSETQTQILETESNLENSSEDNSESTKQSQEEQNVANGNLTNGNVGDANVVNGNVVNESVIKVAKPLANETFTRINDYENTIFVGDSIINGVSFYGCLPNSKVISVDNMTSNMLSYYLNKAVEKSPERIFIMVGLNDANYSNKSSESVVSNIIEAVDKAKKKNNSIEIVVMSVLRVTSAFEGKTSVEVKQSMLDEINEMLKTKAAQNNYKYLDIASELKDSSGYLDKEYTSNGYSIGRKYYPGILNNIADTIM